MPYLLEEMIPETRYARLGDLHLAYQVVGNGPPDILFLDQWFGNHDAQWACPRWQPSGSAWRHSAG